MSQNAAYLTKVATDPVYLYPMSRRARGIESGQHSVHWEGTADMINRNLSAVALSEGQTAGFRVRMTSSQPGPGLLW
jgi:hypothetical protein